MSLRKVEDGHSPEDEICVVTGNEIIVVSKDIIYMSGRTLNSDLLTKV